MISLLFDRQLASSYGDLIDLFPSDALASPRRSTVPLLDHWRVPADRLGELGQVLGVPIVSPVKLSFEYTVLVQQGRGKPSCTDLMIIGSNVAIAMEAKFTEPIYPSVEQWLGTSATGNRVAVLRGWLDLLRTSLGRALDVEAVRTWPYQLVHRAASACSVVGRTPVLVYIGYGNGADAYAAHIDHLSEVLGGTTLKSYVLQCPLHSLPHHLELEQRWLAGDRALGEPVRRALKGGPLFQFGRMRVRHDSTAPAG